MRKMPVSDQPAFDAVLASTLFPAAVKLAQLATVSPTTATAGHKQTDSVTQEQLSSLVSHNSSHETHTALG